MLQVPPKYGSVFGWSFNISSINLLLIIMERDPELLELKETRGLKYISNKVRKQLMAWL